MDNSEIFCSQYLETRFLEDWWYKLERDLMPFESVKIVPSPKKLSVKPCLHRK